MYKTQKSWYNTVGYGIGYISAIIYQFTGAVVVIGVPIGSWCYNIYELFAKDMVTSETIIRLIGIPLWPIGCLMGLFA